MCQRGVHRDGRGGLALEPGRAQHFEVAVAGERVPSSSERAYRPDRALRRVRSAFCSRSTESLRGEQNFFRKMLPA